MFLNAALVIGRAGPHLRVQCNSATSLVRRKGLRLVCVILTFQIRCHKYWPEDNKPMSVFSDILVSKVSEEVSHDWTVRTLKVEKVKIPTHGTNVIRYLHQLPIYWLITFPKMAFLRDSLPFLTSCCAFPSLYGHKYS